MSAIRTFSVALLLAHLACSATAQPQLTWEVVNRFPLLKDEAFDRIQAAWDAGGHESMVSYMTERLTAKSQRTIPKEEFFLVDPNKETHQTASLFADDARIVVVLELKGASGPCTWELPSSGTASAGACKAEIRLPYGASAAAAVTSGGQRFDATVRPSNIVLVSMGDSFSSVEGSPDRAALYSDHTETPVWNDWFIRAPGPYARPVWWDSPCHRSLLS
ncbi:hypothetical protein ACSFA8_22615 [Variovorax sp. RT4R15]|uniref:hypothetical protein n=1 Tax=Variovorax sp. RT4R15 TaxID=3443737 RepID=UPI003F45C5C3